MQTLICKIKEWKFTKLLVNGYILSEEEVDVLRKISVLNYSFFDINAT